MNTHVYTITCVGRLYNGSTVTDYVLREDSTGRTKTVSAKEVKAKMRDGTLKVTNLRLDGRNVKASDEEVSYDKIRSFGHALGFLTMISVREFYSSVDIYHQLCNEFGVEDDTIGCSYQTVCKKLGELFASIAKTDTALINEKVAELLCSSSNASMIEYHLVYEACNKVKDITKSTALKAIQTISKSGIVNDELALQGIKSMDSRLRWHDMKCLSDACKICGQLKKYCDLSIFEQSETSVMLTENCKLNKRFRAGYQYEYSRALLCSSKGDIIVSGYILFKKDYADVYIAYKDVKRNWQKFSDPVKVELGQHKSSISAAHALADTLNKMGAEAASKYNNNDKVGNM